MENLTKNILTKIAKCIVDEDDDIGTMINILKFMDGKNIKDSRVITCDTVSVKTLNIIFVKFYEYHSENNIDVCDNDVDSLLDGELFRYITEAYLFEYYNKHGATIDTHIKNWTQTKDCLESAINQQ